MEAIQSPFKLSFKVMNFYGFYLEENCKIRWKVYGFLVFCFINIQFVLASLYRLFLLENIDDFIVSIVYVIFSVNLSFKVINFKWNQSEILKILEKCDELERKMDSNLVVKVHEEVEDFVKKSFVMDTSVGFILSLSVLALSHGKTFVIPVLYETDNDLLYYVLYAFHYVQVLGIGSSSVAVESILTINLMMIQAQIDSMKEMIKEMNEVKKETLKNFVKFQVQVVRYFDSFLIL